MKKDILIPNLGGVDDSKVIEILVKPKDKIKKDTPLLTLESDKASMDIPSPYEGTVDSIKVKEGDEVSQGDVILVIKDVKEEVEEKEVKEVKEEEVSKKQSNDVYASPFVRRMARELEIDLEKVKATGDKGRVTLDDMKSFLLKSQPKVYDYAKWGDVRYEAMPKLMQISSGFITEAWQNIPQVTQHHWVDITELEKHRKGLKERVTMVAFVMKAIVSCMQKHQSFCRAWVNDKEFAYREYFHIGVAVDTKGGLIVPVCQDVDKKEIITLAKEIQALSEKARDGKLKTNDLEGRCASISSLGGIGGGHFTPIVTPPDGFILGVSRAVAKPIYNEDSVEKRLMLPISLSYDHRLIDGADAARFLVDLESVLEVMQVE